MQESGSGVYNTEKLSFQNFIDCPNNKQNYDDETECNSNKCNDINEKSKNYVSAQQPFECCPNQEKVRSLQLSLGQLRRNGILAGNAWTKEEPKTPCRLVVPDVYRDAEIPKTMCQKDEKLNEPQNPLMIVDMIANKKDRKRVANYLRLNV